MSQDAALDIFFAEADELLDAMDAALLRMEGGEYDNEILNEIFRSAHTIKGSAGIFGLDHIVAFTHVVENILDRARDEEIRIETDLLNLIFKCRDHMAALVPVTAEQFDADQNLQETGQALLSALQPWASEVPESNEYVGGVEVLDSEQPRPSVVGGDWHISLRLSQDALKNGMDPMSFITFLGSIGSVSHIEAVCDALPEWDTFDPETLYLGYELALKTDADRATIENAFTFVQEDSDIRIIAPDSLVETYIELIQSLPERDDRLGEILTRCGAISSNTLRDSLNAQLSEQVSQGKSRPIGAVLTEDKGVPAKLVNAAITKQKSAASAKTGTTAPQLIRIEADRLDHLINLIGELVINRQRVDLLSADTGNDPLIEAVNNLGGFTEQLRDAALNLRMVPIGNTFQRFKRIVRDTAQELGKEILLVIEGAETELDRLMVEKLTDPLTHIVRNAMDHGIESIEDRRASEKTEAGTLKMSAYHHAGHIIIEISDDGGGIEPSKIRAKAVEKGVIDEESQLSDQDILHLVFHPGFSTAESVTNLSGRGVGMDVVKRNVEALQGHIDIQSEVGFGTTFTIRLPLTLAIIDGFHVSSGGTQFIVPQSSVIECTDLASHLDSESRNCINLRGDMIPYLELRTIFKLPAKPEAEAVGPDRSDNLLVVQVGEERAGIVVDHLYGEIQTVVKPLGPIFKPLKGIGGSSLLGNGDIAFILDIVQLIDTVVYSETLRAL